MDCGVPFCHTGTLLSGMASGCPINNLIPEWNDLVYRGLWQEALERLHKTNNFPEFTGRVCPRPCEGSCVLGINDPPVTIKSIECSIVDKGFSEGLDCPRATMKRTGRSCGGGLWTVGAGLRRPTQSGWTSGDRLRARRPHWRAAHVWHSQYEARQKHCPAPHRSPGGGVKFITHVEIGKDMPRTQLREEFDAIVLYCGATKPRDLPIPGRQLQGPFRHGIPARQYQKPAGLRPRR